MARHHRLTLPAPWYVLELIELEERQDSPPRTVKSLHLVDPDAEGGMRLLRSRPATALSQDTPPLPADFEVIE